jgi:hypothetical protein
MAKPANRITMDIRSVGFKCVLVRLHHLRGLPWINHLPSNQLVLRAEAVKWPPALAMGEHLK